MVALSWSDKLKLLGDSPRLASSEWEKTSEPDPFYNCVAWAAWDENHWWEPIENNPDAYWPPGAPREVTLEAYAAALEYCGYRRCTDGGRELGYEKVAIYCRNGIPVHVARQLLSGFWTSKLGNWLDLRHTVHGLSGGRYGEPTVYMSRPLPLVFDSEDQ